MNKVRHIFLVGLSGSGKSTVGKLLAKRLKLDFIDLDKVIEKKAKVTISEVFQKRGEPVFRKMETKELLKAVRNSKIPFVVALGGGSFESAKNRKTIAASGVSVWLRSPINVLAGRLKNHSNRPLLMGEKLNLALKRQLAIRKANFAKADIKILTAHKTPKRVATEIEIKLKKNI